MKIRLIEPITFRSEPLPAGREIEVSDLDAHQLMTSGHAAPVAPVVDPAAPAAPAAHPGEAAKPHFKNR